MKYTLIQIMVVIVPLCSCTSSLERFLEKNTALKKMDLKWHKEKVDRNYIGEVYYYAVDNDSIYSLCLQENENDMSYLYRSHVDNDTIFRLKYNAQLDTLFYFKELFIENHFHLDPHNGQDKVFIVGEEYYNSLMGLD